MKNFSLKFFFVFALAALLTPLFAQSGQGKLVGRIVDAQTKEPLIGANVVVVGTELGSATDADGRYLVLNIVPGTYKVQFSYIGYGKKTVAEYRVVGGITSELNVELAPNMQLDEVVISGKKLFEEKSTNTVKVIDAGEINRLPVKGVEKIAGIQAGVVMREGSGGADGNASINVRGGRSGEVLYIVDGVPQNDVFNGSNAAQVSSSAIEQMQLQIGGFEAKYGQSQSGIVSVTTKSGSSNYSLFADVLTSSFTDKFGYNLYTLNVGGPIIPGNPDNTIFISAERGWDLDGSPSAYPVNIAASQVKDANGNVTYTYPGLHSDYKPNNSSDVWRFSGKTYHNLGGLALRLGANVNFRNSRSFTYTYVKNNSEHNPINKSSNYSYSGRLSQNVNSTSFWNLNVGYKLTESRSGDGIWFDNLEAYGDTAYNAPYLTVQGSRVVLDPVQLFYGKGRVSNGYSRTRNNTLSFDADYTNQMGKHLLELGGGMQYHTLRYYSLAPVAIAVDNLTKSIEERIALQTPYYFGFDITGKDLAESDKEAVYGGKNRSVAAAPKHPMSGYAYLQDRFELNDLVLNVGLRFDYFASKADVLKNDSLPYGYGDPTVFDAADFNTKKAETYLSPRIGIGFPVTQTTVFHAQYGKFIQAPNLSDVFTSVNALTSLLKDQNFGINTGNVNSEITTQYEIGFRQLLGNNIGALNLTAFYKNTKGLVNTTTTWFYRTEGGVRYRYYGPTNSDFGTIKGIAVAVNVTKMNYVSLNLDYTYSLAEGTGSSTSSSTTAAFRNNNGETPKVIAPLDFDQRHTGVINLDFSVPRGDLGWLENLSANLLFSFNSGRPYTPLLKQNITPGGESNLGETKGYVNSAYAPGSARFDLKVERAFFAGGMMITPYLWVENLFNADNPVNVYRSTGSPTSSGFLSTEEGLALAKQRGSAYVSDYQALERSPDNFGIPRLIKLGCRINFANISF